MPRSRFIVTDLREGIDTLNRYLQDCGSNVRLVDGGRNGYQAVDEIEVEIRDSEEVNINGLNKDQIAAGETGSGCRRNVECDTSRECYVASERRVE